MVGPPAHPDTLLHPRLAGVSGEEEEEEEEEGGGGGGGRRRRRRRREEEEEEEEEEGRGKKSLKGVLYVVKFSPW